MPMLRNKWFWIVSLPLVAILLFSSWLGLRYWWNHGYSTGTRTGQIRKMSIKGSPMCKYFSGELVLIGAQPGQTPQVWEFSVDDPEESSPIVQKLKAAERTARPVTVEYRQDLGNKGKLWNCSPTEYYVTDVH
jgi:hypothetical protein